MTQDRQTEGQRVASDEHDGPSNVTFNDTLTLMDPGLATVMELWQLTVLSPNRIGQVSWPLALEDNTFGQMVRAHPL